MTLKKSIGYFLLIILFFCLISFLIYLNENPSKFSGIKNFLTEDLRGGSYNKKVPPVVNNSKIIPTREVKNLGYIFYIGEIEKQDTTNITDDLKNKITEIVYRANFPKSLLKTTAIIFVNTLTIQSEQEIVEPNGHHVKLPESFFNPEFISGGGYYVQTEEGFSFIFINKNKIGNLTDVLTHELGHHLSDSLTNSEWKTYYQLREIPLDRPQEYNNWQLSPREDFAEVYKNIFTGLNIKTLYGSVDSKTKDFINATISRLNY